MTKSKLATTELKETLDAYSKDFKAMVGIKPKQFDIVTIASMTSSLPERKWNAAQGVVNATVLKKDADNKLKALKATKMLYASKTKEKEGLSSADDRKAWVDNHPVIQDAEIACINAEAELLAAKLAYECLDDLFTAGKKILDYLVDQDRANRQYDRFVSEGSKHR